MIKNSAPISEHEAVKLLMRKRVKPTMYSKAEAGKVYFRMAGIVYSAPDSELTRSCIAAAKARIMPYKVGDIVGNSMYNSNTKFNIGDKVKVKGKAGLYIVSQKYGGSTYELKELNPHTLKPYPQWPVGDFTDNELISVKNSLRVQVKDAKGKYIFPMSFAFIKKKYDKFGELTPAYRVIDVYENGTVKLEKYGTVKGSDVVVGNSDSQTSTNPIVANAIAWKSRNASGLSDKFRKGDKVAYAKNPSYRGEIVEAKSLFGHETSYTVKWNDGKTYSVTESDIIKNSAVSTNAEVSDKFEVGKVYTSPYDKKWVCKVLSRNPTSIHVAIKSVRDRSWGVKDEQVTLRINPKRSEEMDCEVARGLDWEFWASEKK